MSCVFEDYRHNCQQGNYVNSSGGGNYKGSVEVAGVNSLSPTPRASKQALKPIHTGTTNCTYPGGPH